jgi:uncharacterized phage protein (TIGR01671 family)
MIKLRAYGHREDRDDYEMFYSFSGFDHYFCPWNENKAICDHTLTQFIGREDRNGTEIYSGDILDLHSTVNGVNLFEVYYNESQARFSIKYYTDRMPKRSLEYEYSVSDFFKPCEFSGEVDFEVIGNIYENPELIK